MTQIPFIYIFQYQNPNKQELKKSLSNSQTKFLDTEYEIIRHLLKENSNHNISEIMNDNNNLNFIKTLFEKLKKISKNYNVNKNIIIKLIADNYSFGNEEKNQNKKILFNTYDICNQNNFYDMIENKIEIIYNKLKDSLNIFVLVEEFIESDNQLESLNPRFTNNHKVQTCFMKSLSKFPELSNFFFRFSRDKIVKKNDSMLFSDEIKNNYIYENLQKYGKEFLDKLNSLIEAFDVDQDFDLLMFSIEFKLSKLDDKKDQNGLKAIEDKSIIPQIIKMKSLENNILENFNENFYYNKKKVSN